MHFVVRHQTCYRYDVPVTLSTHTLRLTPQRVQLRRHTLRVAPEPVTRHATLDAYGNEIMTLTFVGSCQELRVESEVELYTLPGPRLTELPVLPWPIDAQTSSEYYGRAPIDPRVQSFAHALAAETGYASLPFLDHLANTLFTRFDRGVRTVGAAQAAAQTLASGSGACRDLTVLFMEACRSLGIASRFVSGYQAAAQTADGGRYLHAWAEVLLPGIGFCGWDPMHGLRVGEGHVALCAAPEQAQTMPVEGGFTFRGAVVSSTLDFALYIDTR
jgi:transglutaminase-like putative cysteine protease